MKNRSPIQARKVKQNFDLKISRSREKTRDSQIISQYGESRLTGLNIFRLKINTFAQIHESNPSQGA